MHIAYYISSHGFGHAARQQALIKLLSAAGYTLHVRTRAPAKFFDFPNLHYYPYAYDVGVIQPEGLTVDVAASYAHYLNFEQSIPALIQSEVAYLQANAIQLVIGDMPPIAFDIAHEAGLKSIAITNFTWDWIYEAYLADFAGFAAPIERIKASYAQATLALVLPFAHDFSIFPHVQNIPLMVNEVNQSAAFVRDYFQIPPDKKMAVLSMGGMQWGSSDLSALSRQQDWVFLVMPDMWPALQHLPNVRLAPTDYGAYHNLLAHADLVIGKAGASTVSQIIAHQTPFIYTLRPHWRENELLQKGLDQFAHARYLPAADFQAGAWLDQMDAFIAEPYTWPPCATDGAAQAFAIIQQFRP